MRQCIIEVLDEVNVRIIGLDEHTLGIAQGRLTFTVKNSHFMEKVRAGKWNGQIQLLKPSGKGYLHLIGDALKPSIVEAITKAGYEIGVVDKRFKHDIRIPEIDDNLFEGFEHKRFKGTMEAHQVDAINTLTSNGGGIIELATGGGKTIITAGLAQLYHQHGKILVIVPRTDLVLETAATIRAMGMRCGEFYGEEKDPDYVTVTTWQSLEESPELFADVITVICDECHGAQAKVLHKLLTEQGKHVPIRIGMTGTMPEDDLSKYQTIAALGPVVYKKRAYELQDEGFLARCKIFILKYLDQKRASYQKEAERHQYYTDEMAWQYSYQPRIAHLAETIREIAADAETGGNTLVLVRFREYGKRLQELIPEAIYLNGDDKPKYRHQVYQDTNVGEGKILIATYGIASTGIDIARLFNMVIIEPGKQSIGIVQSIGRGLRRADDKSHVNIWHISSDCKFSSNHLKEVRRIYKQHQYPFDIVEVDYE